MSRTSKKFSSAEPFEDETEFDSTEKTLNQSYSSLNLGFNSNSENESSADLFSLNRSKSARHKKSSNDTIKTSKRKLTIKSPEMHVPNPRLFEDFQTSGVFNETKRLLPKKPKTETKKFTYYTQSLRVFMARHARFLGQIKMAVLVIYCVSVCILFGMYDERKESWSQLVVSNHTIDKFTCDNGAVTQSSYFRLKLSGPFKDVKDLSSFELLGKQFIQVSVIDDAKQTLDSLILLSTRQPNTSDISTSTIIKNFELPGQYTSSQVTFIVSTNDQLPNAFQYECFQLNNSFKYAIAFSVMLLVFVYILIIFELIHRTLAAALGAIGGLALIGLVESERPSLGTVVTWVEWETILLVSGMMVIVAIFCDTGLFDLFAVRLFHYSGTRIWFMIGSLCLLSAVLSAVLDNVTTVLLLIPITIRLCEVMKLDPRDIIIGVVVFSNIGGCSTAIGDPPNVIVSANHEINQSGVDFPTFTIHMFMAILPIFVICFIHFRFLLGDADNLVEDIETEFNELKTEINLWTLTYQSITPVTKGEKIVRTLLKEKVSQLQSLLANSLSKTKSNNLHSFLTKSQDLVDTYKITNMRLLIKCSVIFSITLILFFLNPFVSEIHLTIGWISILGALTLMAASANNSEDIQNKDSNLKESNSSLENSDQELHIGIDFDAILHKIEWSTLLFFSALFIFMKCIEELGLLSYLGDLMSGLIKSCNEQDRLVIALATLVILSAVISSLLDNIPFTTAMIPIILQLSEQTNLPLKPLVYALSLGSCLGGNGTLVGASCNLVAAGIAERHGYKITFSRFFRIGFPIMVTSIMAAVIYITITTYYMDW